MTDEDRDGYSASDLARRANGLPAAHASRCEELVTPAHNDTAITVVSLISTLGEAGYWEIEFFETDDGRKPVLNWIKNDLSPTKRRALGSAMRRVLQTHGPAVARSGWGRSVEKGIFEFRLRMNGKEIVNLEVELHGISDDEARDRFGLDPSEDVLLRVFCTPRDGAVVLLLHAYDKGEDPSKRRQQAAIGEARRRLKILESRDAAARKTQRRSGRRQP